MHSCGLWRAKRLQRSFCAKRIIRISWLWFTQRSSWNTLFWMDTNYPQEMCTTGSNELSCCYCPETQKALTGIFFLSLFHKLCPCGNVTHSSDILYNLMTQCRQSCQWLSHPSAQPPRKHDTISHLTLVTEIMASVETVLVSGSVSLRKWKYTILSVLYQKTSR